MKTLKKAALQMDRLFENVSVVALITMTLIVTLQVVTRKLFNFVFFWSEELTLLLLIWFGFMGIAVGFRETLHLAMDSLAKRLPDVVNRVLDKVISLSVIAFGLFFVVYGWHFTRMMHANKLPATEWPVSFMYAVMPVTGAVIIIYAVLQLLGFSTQRHHEEKEEIPK